MDLCQSFNRSRVQFVQMAGFKELDSVSFADALLRSGEIRWICQMQLVFQNQKDHLPKFS